MSQGILETILAQLASLQAAVEANTAALNGGASAGSTSSKTEETAGKTAAGKTTAAKGAKAKKEEPTKPVHSKSEATQAVVAVKEKLGAPAAKELLSSFGIDKLANMTEDKFDDVYAAAIALVNDDAGEEEDGEDDI